MNCKSNNSKKLSISLSKISDPTRLSGRVVSVKHSVYGTLFAATINGVGQLITTEDEEGNPLPFLTKDEILKQIMKFGFYIYYDEKKHLPQDILVFLQNVMNVGFDKITKVFVECSDAGGRKVWRPYIIAMKSEKNIDLLNFGCKVTRKVFNSKLESNCVMNLNREGYSWDWVTYMANISDILNEQEEDTIIVTPDSELVDPEHELTPYIPD